MRTRNELKGILMSMVVNSLDAGVAMYDDETFVIALAFIREPNTCVQVIAMDKGKELYACGFATCGEDDKFDVLTGCRIAAVKAVEDMVEGYFTGKSESLWSRMSMMSAEAITEKLRSEIARNK